MISDTHSHLDMHQFEADREEVIARARAAGLELLVTIGTGRPDDPSIQHTLELADRHDFIYAGIGVHPHDASLCTARYLAQLEELADHPKVVLWGEIGLDYYYHHSSPDVQREVFRLQLRLALHHRMPIAIHCRDAWGDFLSIIREEWAGDNPGGILHSFTGDRAMAREGLALGFHISFSGIATFKSATSIREAAREVPADRLLVETDSPYLAPVPHRGKRNEPAFVVDVARSLSATMQIDFDDLCRQTTINFRRLVGLDLSLESGEK
jgi:TatD DNase family protein